MAPVRLPRILSLLAVVGVLWYVNSTAPRIVPSVLLLLLLYVALTNITRVEALFGSLEASIVRGFGQPVPARIGGK